MAALNFPSSPILNQQETLNGILFEYDGKRWVVIAGTKSISDNTDVDTSGAVDGDALVYNSGTSEWEPDGTTYSKLITVIALGG